MEEIKQIIEGYNQEKMFVQKVLNDAGNYNTYNQSKVNDLKARLKELDGKIDMLVSLLLPQKD